MSTETKTAQYENAASNVAACPSVTGTVPATSPTPTPTTEKIAQ